MDRFKTIRNIDKQYRVSINPFVTEIKDYYDEELLVSEIQLLGVLHMLELLELVEDISDIVDGINLNTSELYCYVDDVLSENDMTVEIYALSNDEDLETATQQVRNINIIHKDKALTSIDLYLQSNDKGFFSYLLSMPKMTMNGFYNLGLMGEDMFTIKKTNKEKGNNNGL